MFFLTFYFARSSRFRNEIEVLARGGTTGRGAAGEGGVSDDVAAFTVNFIKKI